MRQDIKKGVYWLLEGPGGAGKTTLMPRFVDFLRQQGRQVEVVREPGGSTVLEMFRDYIFAMKAQGLINGDQQAALFNGIRYVLGHELNELLINGVDVVSDRGGPSTVVFQTAEGADENAIGNLTLASMVARPNVVLYMDVDAETAWQRRKVDDGGDPFDRQGLGFVERIVGGYNRLYRDKWGGFDWRRIDANLPIDEVFKQMSAIACGVLGLENRR